MNNSAFAFGTYRDGVIELERKHSSLQGKRVRIIFVPEMSDDGDSADLIELAQSAFSFWDNPEDDIYQKFYSQK